MKIAVIIVRVLMGLVFLFASITFLFKLFPVPELTGDVKRFNEGMMASVYMFPLVKIFELLCGIAFVTGRFVALAVVLISPIIINIFLFHAFLARKDCPSQLSSHWEIVFLRMRTAKNICLYSPRNKSIT